MLVPVRLSLIRLFVRLPVRVKVARANPTVEWNAARERLLLHGTRGVVETSVSGPLARLRLGAMRSQIAGVRRATSMLPGVRMQPT